MSDKQTKRIQEARKVLRRAGYGEYTVVKRCKKPSAKGGRYENKKCEQLSIWVLGRKKPMIYRRTSGSGGRATRRGDTRSTEAGDIMSNSPLGDFLTTICLIEAKDRVEINVLDMLPHATRSNVETLRDFWLKTVVQADAADKYPLFIFHRHGTRIDYIIVSSAFYSKLSDYIGLHSSSIYTVTFPNGTVLMALDHFLDWVKPWELAFCFLGDEVGKLVESNYKTPQEQRQPLE